MRWVRGPFSIPAVPWPNDLIGKVDAVIDTVGGVARTRAFDVVRWRRLDFSAAWSEFLQTKASVCLNGAKAA